MRREYRHRRKDALCNCGESTASAREAEGAGKNSKKVDINKRERVNAFDIHVVNVKQNARAVSQSRASLAFDCRFRGDKKQTANETTADQPKRNQFLRVEY